MKCNNCGHETTVDGFALGQVSGMDELQYLAAFKDVARKHDGFLQKRTALDIKFLDSIAGDQPEPNWLNKLLGKLKAKFTSHD